MTAALNSNRSLYYTPEALTDALQALAGSEKGCQNTSVNHDLILANPPFGSRSLSADKPGQAI